jgi:hypothetical protein
MKQKKRIKQSTSTRSSRVRSNNKLGIHGKNSSLNPRWFTLFSLFGVFVFLFGVVYFHTPQQTLRPLASLEVPKEYHVELPGTYMASEPVNANILGSEVVDPKDIITYINEERMKRGARPLRVSDTLMKAAQMRADTILRHQNFSHQDPYEGIQLDTVLPLMKYPFSWASENIGMGDSTARAFVTGFMNSPSHRANLLNPELVETGAAIVTGPYKQYYVNIAVQLFAIPVDRATFLGYTQKDVQEYKQLLTDIGKQLELTKKMREEDPERLAYYEQWQTLLIRQQEIIATLSHTMAEEKPFAREMIAMIKEYNANWASIPVDE